MRLATLIDRVYTLLLVQDHVELSDGRMFRKIPVKEGYRIEEYTLRNSKMDFCYRLNDKEYYKFKVVGGLNREHVTWGLCGVRYSTLQLDREVDIKILGLYNSVDFIMGDDDEVHYY